MFELFNNHRIGKKAQSTGYVWVFGLISLFGLGVMYIVFNQVFVGHLEPTIKNYANSTYQSGGMDEGSFNEVIGGIDKYMRFFHALPYILFFTVVIYMISVAIRKEREGL